MVDENSNNNSRSNCDNNDDAEEDLDLFYEDSDNALFNDPKNDDDDDLFVDPIQRTMHLLDGPTSRRLV